MKIIAISDIHGQIPSSLPPGDVLVIAGDICPDFNDYRRRIGVDKGEQRQSNWLRTTFSDWLEDIHGDYEAIISIAGNHDYVFEHPFLVPNNLPWTYLKDSGVEIGDVNFWGTPWVPNLARWAFYGAPPRLKARAAMIPDGTDVLISHGPPLNHGDYIPTSPKQQNKYGNFGGVNVGDPSLNEAIERVWPEVVICGHIHESYGCHKLGWSLVYNSAQVDENYEMVNAPHVIEVER